MCQLKQKKLFLRKTEKMITVIQEKQDVIVIGKLELHIGTPVLGPIDSMIQELKRTSLEDKGE